MSKKVCLIKTLNALLPHTVSPFNTSICIRETKSSLVWCPLIVGPLMRPVLLHLRLLRTPLFDLVNDRHKSSLRLMGLKIFCKQSEDYGLSRPAFPRSLSHALMPRLSFKRLLIFFFFLWDILYGTRLCSHSSTFYTR